MTISHAPLICVGNLADPKIALLGAMQSLFETSMYTFVFLWTPALSPNGEHLEHGLIFTCFMMACMAGSTIAGRLLSDPRRYQVSHYMKVGSQSYLFDSFRNFGTASLRKRPRRS